MSYSMGPASEAGRLSPAQQAQLNHLDRLPSELLLNVASFLNEASLIQFSKSSRRIYSVICSDLALRKKILRYIFSKNSWGGVPQYDFFLLIEVFLEDSLATKKFDMTDLLLSFDRHTLGIAIFDLFARHPHLVKFLNSGLLTVSQAMRAPSVEYLRLLLPIGEGKLSPVHFGSMSPIPEQKFAWIFDIPFVGQWVDMDFIPEYQQQRSRTPMKDDYFEYNDYSGRQEFDSQRWAEDSLRHQREREQEQSISQIRECFLIALREKLMTIEQAWAAPHNYQEDSQCHLKTLLTPNGLLALRKKWITVEQAWAAPSVEHLGFLFGQKELIRWEVGTCSDRSGTHSEEYGFYIKVHGLEALSSKLLILTVEQAWEAPTADHLGFLLTEEGLIALRYGLITVQDVWNAVIPEERNYGRNSRRHCLQYLLTPNGLIALRKKLMTVKQALSFSDPVLLKYLLTSNGLIALRENLISVDEVLHGIESWNLRIDIKESLELLLTPEGLELLRAGFTVDQAFSTEAKKLNNLLNPKV
jgi:hypothetical protein